MEQDMEIQSDQVTVLLGQLLPLGMLLGFSFPTLQVELQLVVLDSTHYLQAATERC